MRVEVVGVGTELLLGQIANTNARWIGERLAEVGVDVLFHQVVGDNLDRIVSVLELAASRSDVVIVTGGLGPDRGRHHARRARAGDGRAAGARSRDRAMLRARFAGFGAGAMPESNLRQADVPEGSARSRPTAAPRRGSSPDLPGGVRIYAMPGVPTEMTEMMRSTSAPGARRPIGAAVVVSRTLRCAGIGESRVAEMLRGPVPGVDEPEPRLPRVGGRGEGAAHGEGRRRSRTPNR